MPCYRKIVEENITLITGYRGTNRTNVLGMESDSFKYSAPSTIKTVHRIAVSSTRPTIRNLCEK